MLRDESPVIASLPAGPEPCQRAASHEEEPLSPTRRSLPVDTREHVGLIPHSVKTRPVPVDPGTIGTLKGQAARRLEDQHERDDAWVETGLFLTAENGVALDPEPVTRYFRQAMKRWRLPSIRLHDLRHTHATLALQAGIHPKVVSERLGHANISITLDTYSHAIPAMQEEAAALIAGPGRVAHSSQTRCSPGLDRLLCFRSGVVRRRVNIRLTATRATARRSPTVRKKKSRAWWAVLWSIIGGVSVLIGLYTFFAPTEWLKPQSLWTKPSPRIASADVVRRWASLGVDGLTEDTSLLRVSGDQIPPNVRERDWHLLIYWRIPDSTHAKWRLGREAASRSTPASLPMGMMSSGPWEMDFTAVCPASYRGVIELKPVLLPPATYQMLFVNDRGSAAQAMAELPSSANCGNAYLAETNGMTAGEPASPYRQIGDLSANVTVDRFRVLLGPETSRTRANGGVRYSFVTPDYFVEAIADRDDRVMLYAVTTLSSAFTPTFRYRRINKWVSVTLGVTRFSQSGLAPDRCYGYYYANRHLYFEAHYLAAPGNYQTMFLADNYIGRPKVPSNAATPAVLLTSYGRVRRELVGRLRGFREGTTINTFGFCAPNSRYERLLRRADTSRLWIGPTTWDLGSMLGNVGL